MQIPPNRKTTDYVYTIMGQSIFPEEMIVEQVIPYDIAYSLAGIYRYNGHTRISVLRHSLAIYHLLVRDGASQRERLFGLLHDAPEAYVMDVPVPKKKYMRVTWERAHDHIESCIFAYVNFTPRPTESERALVHKVDKSVIEYEMDNPEGPERKGSKKGAHGMVYPGPRYLGPIQRRWIEQAYQWQLTEEELIDQFLDLLASLSGLTLPPDRRSLD